MLTRKSIAVFLLLSFILFGCQTDVDEKTGIQTAVEPDRGITALDNFIASFQVVDGLRREGHCGEARDSAMILFAAGDSLFTAVLPEFYEDIAEQFDLARNNMKTALDEFRRAAEGIDDHLTKEKFDVVRANLITMINLFSPDISELDDFHEILVPLWHDALPDNDYDSIRASIPKLMSRASALTRVTLPEKYAFLQKVFTDKSQSLVKAVEELSLVCLDDTLENMIDDKMETMHDAYHDLIECID